MKWLAIAAFVLLPLFGQSQNKGQVTFNGGLATPTGFYNGDDYYEAAGYRDNNLENAKPGYNFQFSANYRIAGFFGLSGMLHYQSNGIENHKYQYIDYIGSPQEVEVSNLNFIGLFLGPLFSFKLYKELRLETRFLLSYALYQSPEVNAVFDFGSGEEKFVRKQESNFALTGLAGIGLRYSFPSRLCIVTNVEYVSGRPDFSPVDYTEPNGSKTGFSTLYSPIVETVNYNIGVGLTF